jgi:sialate O-acetylesterase
MNGEPLREFTIAGADHKFLPAVAEIDNDFVLVYCKQIPQPIAVRYAWRDIATPNLANKEGLPASPFRTDDWSRASQPKSE